MGSWALAPWTCREFMFEIGMMTNFHKKKVSFPKLRSSLFSPTALCSKEGIYPIIEDIRHLSLPAIQALTEILIWKKSTVTMVIVVVLLVISALFAWAAYLHRTAGESGNMSRAEEVTTLAL